MANYIEAPKKKLHKVFSPLNTACSIQLMSPASPTGQVYNAGLNIYEPDRTATPLVLCPVVTAWAQDGTWKDLWANAHLAQYSWYANGVEISTLSEWSGQYAIDTAAGTERGAISIMRNLAVGTTVLLKFKGVLADYRTGENIPVESQEVELTTSQQAEDQWGISIADAQGVAYNPFIDKLADYDYEVAQGLRKASAVVRESCIDGNAYLHRIPVVVTCGAAAATGYTLEIWKKSGSTYVKMSVGDSYPELEEITATQITLDLRVLESADFLIKAMVGTEEKAQVQFGMKRVYPDFKFGYKSDADIQGGQQIYMNQAMMMSNGQKVDYPARVCIIKWYTESAGYNTSNGTIAKKAQEWQEGDTLIARIKDLGIGDTQADGWLELEPVAGQKDACKVLTDEDGNIFVDENGDRYIDD